MENEKIKPIKALCILSFVVVAITSAPLLVAYLKGVSPKYSLITDLHVWAGVIFIVLAILRIIKVKLTKKS